MILEEQQMDLSSGNFLISLWHLLLRFLNPPIARFLHAQVTKAMANTGLKISVKMPK